jgi:RNA polymerase sigma-70 factor (ECF subfamily)
MTANLSHPARWLAEHGDVLYRFALARVRQRTVAEDLVQETLLAALSAQKNFKGDSSERTWLIGILKNKLIDHWRKSSREAPSPTDDETVDRLFEDDAEQHWRQEPKAWANPDSALQDKQFWAVLQECLKGLPENQARAFCLTEFDGLPGAEVCKVLNVASTNFWVLLYRARVRLRQCLENEWFESHGHV